MGLRHAQHAPDLPHRLAGGEIARGHQHDHAFARTLEHRQLAKRADVVDSGVGARVREKDQAFAALDRACEIATPITAEQQAAREQLWTPGDDDKTDPAVAKPTLWTPGQPR